MKPQQGTTHRHIYRGVFFCFSLLLTFVTLFSDIKPAVWANEVKAGDTITIVTPGTEARLCPQPGCGPDEHITRIPEGTVLTIQDTEAFFIGTFKVQWFAVVYQNHRGWISIYDTDQAKKIKDND